MSVLRNPNHQVNHFLYKWNFTEFNANFTWACPIFFKEIHTNASGKEWNEPLTKHHGNKKCSILYPTDEFVHNHVSGNTFLILSTEAKLWVAAAGAAGGIAPMSPPNAMGIAPPARSNPPPNPPNPAKSKSSITETCYKMCFNLYKRQKSPFT